MPHVKLEIMNYTKEAHKIWLEKALLTVINMKTNGVVQQKTSAELYR